MPIPPDVLLSFLGVTALLVLSPGPDTMLILRYSFGSGQRVGLAAVAGVQLGLMLHTASVVFGLSLLIAASPIALRAIAFAGALYLGWLGTQCLFQSGARGIAMDGAAKVGAAKACRDGALTNMLNPKVILLFVALLPQFVSAERGPVGLQLGILGALIVLMSTLWQAGLTFGAERMRRLIARRETQRLVNRATGVVFLGFAALMVYEHAI